MDRIPEPELMNDDAQARAYSEADFEKPHSSFVDLLLGKVDLPQTGCLLDLGCGPADVLCRTANACPTLKFVGVDGAEAMLKYGQQRVQALGLSERIDLVLANLPGDKIEGKFDGVISNSLLHHLHNPEVLWRTINTYAPKDSPVFVMDLMRPEDETVVKSMVKTYAEGEPEVLRHDFFQIDCRSYQSGGWRWRIYQSRYRCKPPNRASYCGLHPSAFDF